MSSAIDTNVLLNLAGGDAGSARKTAALLERESRVGGLVVSPLVYAECLAHPGWKRSDLDTLLRETRIGLDWNLSETVWISAGTRFATFANRRRRSEDGQPRRILADFVIGAHALDLGAIITYDGFFAKYFPELRIIDK